MTPTKEHIKTVASALLLLAVIAALIAIMSNVDIVVF